MALVRIVIVQPQEAQSHPAQLLVSPINKINRQLAVAEITKSKVDTVFS